MKRLLVALMLVGVSTTPAMAKKKKTPTTQGSAEKGKEKQKSPPPGNKGTNEGAQGRINATEDAAQGADSPQFQHRP